MDESMDDIINIIKYIRRVGITTCDIRYETNKDIDDVNQTKKKIDAFVKSFGFRGLNKDWVEINGKDALKILTEILHKNIAYGTSISNRKDSFNIGRRLMSLFKEKSKAFTNGNLVVPNADPNDVEGSFIGISSSTFDTGVVLIDEEKIAIVWIQEDD